MPDNSTKFSPAHRLAIKLTDPSSIDLKQRFAASASELHDMFDAGASSVITAYQNSDRERIASVENIDNVDEVIWVVVDEPRNLKTCKVMTRLVMQRGLIGNNYEIMVDPGPRQYR